MWINKLLKNYVGVDIIEIRRVERAISTWQSSFLEHVYTKAELYNSHKNIASLAARFAAKEALIKALGSNLKGSIWKDIEILSDNNGAPHIKLHREVLKTANKLGINGFSLSMSHDGEYAIAFLIGNAT